MAEISAFPARFQASAYWMICCVPITPAAVVAIERMFTFIRFVLCATLSSVRRMPISMRAAALLNADAATAISSSKPATLAVIW
ncbi:hypothetical protein [Aureimonas ureilytica]|uniref:hypothetical protein n=1 Tax=Aureimonas ureilytica TaxID=401562 RepID=UPI001FCE2EDD|nr:hypothetical protein [Aureimonas ureilytica]